MEFECLIPLKYRIGIKYSNTVGRYATLGKVSVGKWSLF